MTRMLMELRAGFGLTSPQAHLRLPTEDLPEPLRESAEQMQSNDLTSDERRAAAGEFLARSEEWVDRAR
jgi:hypothetical protein